MDDSLQKLLDDGVIDDIRTRLMSGKEASVFVVERKGELIAAKVYKAREQRTFKATASYTEGRNQTRNTRDKRAMSKRTNYGKELIEKSWRDMEYEALTEAFHAGVRVPEPYLLYDDVLLMQLLVDDQGNPAPRLADFELPADVAELLHREIYGQVRLLLMCGKIHGDLSAFNILIAEGGPTIIDMPQVVDAAGNNSAAEILGRDLRNVTEHLAKFDARLLRFRDCGLALFQHWQRGTLEQATEPQEGTIRSDAAHKSRRVRDAERGKMGRAPGRRNDGPPRFDDRGPPRVDDRGPPRVDDRGPPRTDRAPPRDDRRDRGPPQQRDDRGPPRVDDRGPPRPPQQPRDDRGAPRFDDRGPQRPPQQQRDDRGPPRFDDRGPPQRPPHQRDDRGPPRFDDRGPPQQQRDDRGPPRFDDRGPPQQRRDDRGPPRFDDRGPPQQQRDDRGAPRFDDRGPPQRDDRGAPRFDDRGPPPRRDDRGPPPRDDRGPPPRDDRGPPPRRDDRGPPPRRDDRGPPRFDDRGPPPRRDDRRPPPRRDDRGPPPRDDRARVEDQDRGPPRDDRGPPRFDDRGSPRGRDRRPPPAIERVPPRPPARPDDT